MQPVSQLHQHHADIVAHGQHNLADIFHLAVDGAGAARIVGGRDILNRQVLQLGDAIDQLGDGAAKFAPQRLNGHIAIFGDIVEQARGDGLGIHLHFS